MVTPDAIRRLESWRVALLLITAAIGLAACDDESPRSPVSDLVAGDVDTTPPSDALDVTYAGEMTDPIACGPMPGADLVCCREGQSAPLACIDAQWSCPTGFTFVSEFACVPEEDLSAPDLGAECAVCGPTEYCRWSDGGCGLGAGGSSCAPATTDCPLDPEPVCGCDGEIHLNPCMARATGADVWVDGPCDVPPGTIPCGARYCQRSAAYCRLESGRSGLDAGECIPFTDDACFLVSQPDCACLASEVCNETCVDDGDGGLTITCD